ncbi:MAG: hypothetical protein KF716_30495 [Anaerolineae bacterium]|nr:hypothetical protein [Anaerolineae bacterium]
MTRSKLGAALQHPARPLLRSSAFDYEADDTPEPESATGQYPDDVWADSDTSAAVYAMNADETDEEMPPEPESATGQYPADVWADSDTSAAVYAMNADEADEEMPPEPESATGQYPAEVWADSDTSAAVYVTELAKRTPARIESARPRTLADEPITEPVSAPPTPPVLAVKAETEDRTLGLKADDYSDQVGGIQDPEQAPEILAGKVPLDVQEIYQIIREVVAVDSGAAPYAFVAADEEFNTPGHLAYQKRHFGLAVGIVRASQASGQLGHLVEIMQRRDPAAFSEIFGAEWQSLLATTNAAAEPDRLRPVEGQPLWSALWIERFKRAADVQSFQIAQNEHAIEHLFRPMLPTAYELGLMTDRGLAMALDRVVTQGLGAGLRWVVNAVGMLRTGLQRTTAMRLLGFESVAQLQAAAEWTPQDGIFGSETHAALVGELRRRGLIPLPMMNEMMDRLVNAAEDSARTRLERLRHSTHFDDVIYSVE